MFGPNNGDDAPPVLLCTHTVGWDWTQVQSQLWRWHRSEGSRLIQNIHQIGSQLECAILTVFALGARTS